MDRGIDIPINKQVQRFTDKLWTENNCEYFGRVFLNERDKDKIPQRYIVGNDYRDVLINDAKDCTSFFEVEPESKYNGIFTATVNILFSVNLSRLYPAYDRYEATEKAHIDAATQIERVGLFTITGLIRGLTAFKSFDMVKESDDYHPRYLFAIKTNVKYINC